MSGRVLLRLILAVWLWWFCFAICLLLSSYVGLGFSGLVFCRLVELWLLWFGWKLWCWVWYKAEFR